MFVAREQSRPMAPPPLKASVSVITMGELHVSLLSATDEAVRVRRAETFALARSMDPVPSSEWVMDEWARLVSACRDAGIASVVKRTDSLIAATAISLGVPVVTQDNDYDRLAAVLPQLHVMRV